MVKLDEHLHFQDWLRGKLGKEIVPVQARIALRAVPLYYKVKYFRSISNDADYHLPLWRGMLSGLNSDVLSDADLKICSDKSYKIVEKIRQSSEDSNPDNQTFPAAFAFNVIYSAFMSNSEIVEVDIGILSTNVYYISSIDNSIAIWDCISSDIDSVNNGASYSRIMSEKLWIDWCEPDWSKFFWKELKSHYLSRPDEHWHVWIDWWEDRRDGKPYNIEMEREIVLIPNEDWEKGPAHVNPMIAEIRAKYSLPSENRRGLPFGSQDGAIGLRGVSMRSNDDDAALFHAALSDDMTRLATCLANCGNNEDPYGALVISTDAMCVALGPEIAQTHTSKLWLAARKLREIERVDRRTQTEFGVNEPPLDTEIGEALRTTLATFTAFCLNVPALQKLEQANRDNAEVIGISLDAIEPILAMIRAENEKFLDEVHAAFGGLMADARSEIEGVAERGEAVALASVENLINRLIAEAIIEDRKDQSGPFWEAYRKKAGEHAANLTLGSLSFGAKAVIAYYFADLIGFTEKLPNGDNYRDLLEKIIKSPSK